MTELSEQDWLLVNGYHDGELPEPQRASFEERLRREPALAEALAGLRELSRGLGALRAPAAPPPPAANAPRAHWRWLAAGALAAALAVAVLLPALRPGDNSAMALHAAFVAQDFAVDESMLSPAATVRTAGLPDLGAARLALVASREIEGGTAAHYAGVNGCRLTFFDTAEPVALSAAEDVRTAAWQNDTRYFAIVAGGMDRDRFHAITTYLMQLTQQGRETDTRLALLDATRKATSCP